MKTLPLALAALSSVLMSCGSPNLFPPSVAREAGQPEFGVLQARPDVFKGRAVQLAGRIIGATEDATGTTIVAQKLDLVRYPVYAPQETMTPTERFAIRYPGKVDPAGLWYGNKFVVIAVALGNGTVDLDGVSRTAPIVRAQCMHIWKTGGYGVYDVEDFPHTQDTYYPLEHETYCAR